MENTFKSTVDKGVYLSSRRFLNGIQMELDQLFNVENTLVVDKWADDFLEMSDDFSQEYS